MFTAIGLLGWLVHAQVPTARYCTLYEFALVGAVHEIVAAVEVIPEAGA